MATVPSTIIVIEGGMRMLAASVIGGIIGEPIAAASAFTEPLRPANGGTVESGRSD